VVGFLSRIVTGVYFTQASIMYQKAADASIRNDTVAFNDFVKQGNERRKVAVPISAILSICIVLVLLMLLAGFLVVGTVSYRIIAAAMRVIFSAKQKIKQATPLAVKNSNSESPVDLPQSPQDEVLSHALMLGSRLQVKLAITFAFLFAAALLRSVFGIM
jgi:Na+/H+ antiporter NhaC